MDERTKKITELITKYCNKSDKILEIGCGNGRHVKHLCEIGYNVTGLDKNNADIASDIYEYDWTEWDVIYTMSCLFLLREYCIFEDIAKHCKMIITVEGESSKGEVIGRDYEEVFKPFGFKQLYMEENVFNKYGVARVLKYEMGRKRIQ